MLRRGVNGIFLLILGILYLLFAAYILLNADWNPHMDNYIQYIVGLKGRYVSMMPTENGYVGVISSQSGEYILFLDQYGEIIRSYQMNEDIYGISNIGGFIGVLTGKPEERNVTVYLFGENGEIIGSRRYNLLWTVARDWKSPPHTEKGYFAIPVKRKNACGVMIIAVDGNTDNPSAWVAFRDPCDVNITVVGGRTKIYAAGEDNYRAYLLELYPGSLSAMRISSIWGIHPIYVSEVDMGVWLAAMTDDNALALLSISGKTLNWGKKIYFSNPVLSVATGGGRVFVNDTRLHWIGIDNDGNITSHYVSDEGIYPAGYTEDVLTYIVYGNRSGSPAYVKNVKGTVNCPENFYEEDTKISAKIEPALDVTEFEWRKTVIEVHKITTFPGEVSLDEDFACYSP